MLFPVEITIHCAICGREQRWKSSDSYNNEVRTDAMGFETLTLVCKNCTSWQTKYFLNMLVKHSGGTIIKVGQYPPLERQPSKSLAEAMTETDAKFYRNALTCRNSNYGIGALAYLRRIVEDRINYLLDLVAEAAKALGSESPELAKLEDVKRDRRFSEKIDYAANLLPANLRIRGHNPIATLHELTSEGLHSKSEEECVDVFDRCKLAFEYVVTNLKESKEHAEAYAKAMYELHPKKRPGA